MQMSHADGSRRKTHLWWHERIWGLISNYGLTFVSYAMEHAMLLNRPGAQLAKFPRICYPRTIYYTVYTHSRITRRFSYGRCNITSAWSGIWTQSVSEICAWCGPVCASRYQSWARTSAAGRNTTSSQSLALRMILHAPQLPEAFDLA